MKTFIDFIYSLLIGAAVAVFVGVGIWAFYSGPEYPEYPSYPTYNYSDPNGAEMQQFQQQQDEFNKKLEQHEKEQKSYQQKVTVIALIFAALFFAGGIYVLKRNYVLGEGLGLGGVFTAGYASVMAALSEVRQLVFVSITIVLAMLIVLVLFRVKYLKFEK